MVYFSLSVLVTKNNAKIQTFCQMNKILSVLFCLLCHWIVVYLTSFISFDFDFIHVVFL
jgi:hypothetical protein